MKWKSAGLVEKQEKQCQGEQKAFKGDIWSEPCPLLLLLLSPAPREEELSSLGEEMKERSMFGSERAHLSLE